MQPLLGTPLSHFHSRDSCILHYCDDPKKIDGKTQQNRGAPSGSRKRITEKLALLKSSKNVGVKGILPLGCFPLWGREGVTLQTANLGKRITKKQDFNRAEKLKKRNSTE
jgi:hypothetical protein